MKQSTTGSTGGGDGEVNYPKKPKLSKTERRALQEAQRAAKAAKIGRRDSGGDGCNNTVISNNASSKSLTSRLEGVHSKTGTATREGGGMISISGVKKQLRPGDSCGDFLKVGG